MWDKIYMVLFVFLLLPTTICAALGFYFHRINNKKKLDYIMFLLTLLFGAISVIGIAKSIIPGTDNAQIDNSYTEGSGNSSEDLAKLDDEESTKQTVEITVNNAEPPKSPYYSIDLGVEFTAPMISTSWSCGDGEDMFWYYGDGTSDLKLYEGNTVIGNAFYILVDCHRTIDSETFSKLKCHTSLYTPDGIKHEHTVYIDYNSSLGMVSVIGILPKEELIEGETYIINVELIINGKSYVANDMRVIYHNYSSIISD